MASRKLSFHRYRKAVTKTYTVKGRLGKPSSLAFLLETRALFTVPEGGGSNSRWHDALGTRNVFARRLYVKSGTAEKQGWQRANTQQGQTRRAFGT